MRIRVVRGEPSGVEAVELAVRSIAATRETLRARAVSFAEKKNRLASAASEARGCPLAFVTRSREEESTPRQPECSATNARIAEKTRAGSS